MLEKRIKIWVSLRKITQCLQYTGKGKYLLNSFLKIDFLIKRKAASLTQRGSVCYGDHFRKININDTSIYFGHTI